MTPTSVNIICDSESLRGLEQQVHDWNANATDGDRAAVPDDMEDRLWSAIQPLVRTRRDADQYIIYFDIPNDFVQRLLEGTA